MDKFSQLIAQGIANFEYTPIAHELPDQCPICRAYNNVYSLANDTHMSTLPDGRHVITGHAVSNKRNFDWFINSSCWGWVDFTDSGFGAPVTFFYKHQLKGHYDILNGDNVYILEELPEEKWETNAICPDCVNCVGKTIPEQLNVLTTDGNAAHVRECFNQSNIVKALNESVYVKGNNWIPVGLSDGVHFVSIGKNKTYIL